MNYFQTVGKAVGDYLAGLQLYFDKIKTATTDGVNASTALKEGGSINNLIALNTSDLQKRSFPITGKRIRFSFQGGTSKIIDCCNFQNILIQIRASNSAGNVFRFEESIDNANWLPVKMKDIDDVVLTTYDTPQLTGLVTYMFVRNRMKYVIVSLSDIEDLHIGEMIASEDHHVLVTHADFDDLDNPRSGSVTGYIEMSPSLRNLIQSLDDIELARKKREKGFQVIIQSVEALTEEILLSQQDERIRFNPYNKKIKQKSPVYNGRSQAAHYNQIGARQARRISR